MNASILRIALVLALAGAATGADAGTPRAKSAASGIDATITLLGTPVADVAAIPTVSAHRSADYSHSDTLPLVNTGGISAGTLAVTTTWTNAAGTVNNASTAQVDNAGVSVAGLVTLALTNVDAAATVAGGCPDGGLLDTGTTTVGGLTLSVLGLPVPLGPLPNPIPPNYNVTVPPTAGVVSAMIRLNEQIASGDGGIVTSLDVNGAHVELELLDLLGQATHVSLVVSSASAKVDCRTDAIFDDGFNEPI
ncbi:MAG TPA: hypothetical protein VJ724_03045 [Tahibacter sp.]|nr:hypothetical protein [Tahibacter sp.]